MCELVLGFPASLEDRVGLVQAMIAAGWDVENGEPVLTGRGDD
jgi:hypothetical protein